MKKRKTRGKKLDLKALTIICQGAMVALSELGQIVRQVNRRGLDSRDYSEDVRQMARMSVKAHDDCLRMLLQALKAAGYEPPPETDLEEDLCCECGETAEFCGCAD